MIHAAIPNKKEKNRVVDLIRLSVGIEDIEDLKADLAHPSELLMNLIHNGVVVVWVKPLLNYYKTKIIML